MIRCKSCGHVGEYECPFCPSCRARYTLTEREIEEKIAEAEHAMEVKDYVLATECYHLLADMGHTPSEREYAIILERGELTDRDLDGAMTYFGRAAEKNDAYSAYRYSRLAERVGAEVARFWLAFSAVLGCKDAYPALADRLSREGDEASANYFYYLAAACDDTESIVTMAKRYYNGIGVPASEAHAKWYLDKLSLPPIHAVKLAWALRRRQAEEPEAPTLESYDGFLLRLAIKAEDFGIATAYHKLRSLLSDRGDINSRMILGMLYAEGIGTRQSTERALDLLSSAAAHGSAEAYRHLGDIYLAGRLVPRDTERALECYRAAASMGLANAYEIMGDVYCDGRLVDRDVSEAIRLYDLAASEGDSSAEAKSTALKEKRESLYKRGLERESTDPVAAFRDLAVSTGMGYLPAYVALARAYREGIGTRADRPCAFRWLLAAAEAGYDGALYDLALCYSRGIGVNRSLRLALKHLRAAARAGYDDACTELRLLLERKKKRLVRATYARAMELLYMRKPHEAREYLLVCLKMGHGKGIYTLGCLNEFGIGIPTNRELAFALYERAFELRFRDPRAVYKLRVLKMCRDWG